MQRENWGEIYRQLGATPVVNAVGSVTLLGGSTPLPEVQEVMQLANDAYIPLAELELKVGGQIADLLRVPAAYVTSGAGSALTLATAAFMAGSDDDKIQQLPDTSGMPHEILIQRRQHYWYDRCLELAGARLVDVGTDEGTTDDDLRRAINEKTAVVHYPVFEQNPVDTKVLSLERVIEIADSMGKQVMVDSAGQIYPLENLGKYVRMGAAFQAIAAKYMGAPHSTGLALGTPEVVDAISRHSFIGYETRRIRGIGRPHKVDRQEIMGAFAAVKLWMGTNHEERLARAESQTRTIIDGIKDIPGLTVKMIDNIKAHQPFGLTVDVDSTVAGMTVNEIVAALKNQSPPVWTRTIDGGDTIVMHVFGLADGEDRIVADSIAKVLKSDG